TAQKVLQNGYFQGVRQYGSDGIATLDPLRVGDPSDPANPFKSGSNGNAIDDVVQNQIKNGPVPPPSTPPPTPIYAVVTPPGVKSDSPSLIGFNQKTNDKPEVWLGTDPVSNTNNSVNLDNFSLVFGHEIAEIMTDVGEKGFEVQTPQLWAAAKGTGDGQIGD